MNTLHVEITDVMSKLVEMHKRGLYGVTIEDLSNGGLPSAHISFDAFHEIFPDVEACDTSEVTYGDNDQYHHVYNVYKAQFAGMVFIALDARDK